MHDLDLPTSSMRALRMIDIWENAGEDQELADDVHSECEKHGDVTKVVLRGPPQEVLVRIFVQFAAHSSAEAAVAVRNSDARMNTC